MAKIMEIIAKETKGKSCGISKKTVNKVLKVAKEKGISWPLDSNQTDAVIEQLLFPIFCFPGYLFV